MSKSPVKSLKKVFKNRPGVLLLVAVLLVGVWLVQSGTLGGLMRFSAIAREDLGPSSDGLYKHRISLDYTFTDADTPPAPSYYYISTTPSNAILAPVKFTPVWQYSAVTWTDTDGLRQSGEVLSGAKFNYTYNDINLPNFNLVGGAISWTWADGHQTYKYYTIKGDIYFNLPSEVSTPSPSITTTTIPGQASPTSLLDSIWTWIKSLFARLGFTSGGV